jgi:mono/diheme cytochrome c family protein/small nuclear ribonucleoprotein (snRNP)-like protein
MLVVLLLTAAAFPQAASQNQKSTEHPSNVQDKRVERTREFLGLGRAPDATAAARGEKLYSTNCAFCHGAKATGAEGPDLVRSRLVLHDEKGEILGPFLAKGRPDRGMPSFNFTEAQSIDIAEFLHMRVELAVDRALYKVQDVVTGDAKAGEAYFNGAGQCSTCHSPTGDLAHIATKFEPADLQAQFLYPGSSYAFRSAGKPAATKVTVTLGSGEVVRGSLKRLDDFNISMIDSSGAYRSWPRNEVRIELEDRLAAHRKLLDQYTDADMHNVLAYMVTLK